MLALSTGSLYTYGLDRVFGLAKEAGFDGIEVLVDGRWDTRQADYLKHLMDRHELPIVSLHSPFDLIRVPGWEQDPLWRLKRTVGLAEALGAQVVVAHPPLGGVRISLRVIGASNPTRDLLAGCVTSICPTTMDGNTDCSRMGICPLADFLRRLNQDGYGGIVAVELQPDALGAGDDNQVLANLWAVVDFYRGHFAREGC